MLNVLSETPFGQIPLLEVDGTVLCQSQGIERLVAKRLGRWSLDVTTAASADSFFNHVCTHDLKKGVQKFAKSKQEL